MAFRLRGNQLAGRALLGAPTQVRGYCQQVSKTSKSDHESALNKGSFIVGALTATISYMMWAKWQQRKIEKMVDILNAEKRMAIFHTLNKQK